MNSRTLSRTRMSRSFPHCLICTGSVGNMVSTESPARAKQIFEYLLFLNFWIIGCFSILLFTFINPFITLWIGDSYLLDIVIVFIISLNMYMRYIRNTQLIFIDTYGLFQEIRIKCIKLNRCKMCRKLHRNQCFIIAE